MSTSPDKGNTSAQLEAKEVVSRPKRRDPIDLISSLGLPITLALVGGLYTWQKDASDRRASVAQRTAETERQQLDRDTGYVKLLSSTNERERDLGLRIIEVLEKENKFSPDMIPVVQAVANGRPGDSNTQKAQDILASLGAQNTSIGKSSPGAPPRPSVVDKEATSVYIQIGSEEQRKDAEVLQARLKQMGYPAPGVELVPNGTVHTYVRFFSLGNRSKADSISETLKQLGFSSEVQNFATGRQLPQLEVWIGTSEKPKAETGH